jgi:hypothetical protein
MLDRYAEENCLKYETMKSQGNINVHRTPAIASFVARITDYANSSNVLKLL